MTQATMLTLGTRGSPLALCQAREAARLAAQAHGAGAERIAISVIRTSGDLILDRALSEAGGKGLFTKELDEALLRGDIDAGVHSAKDLPTVLPDGVVIGGYLPREDVRDALISRHGGDLDAIPQGGTVGTASLRRAAQVLRLRPDLKIALLRGNVETRLRKVEAGEFDAALLALAGLKRLGLAHRTSAILDTDRFLPACGQGAVAITVRAGDAATAAALAPIYDEDTACALACERAFLKALDGSCRTPIAGLGVMEEDLLRFRGLVFAPDGQDLRAVGMSCAPEKAAVLGDAAGTYMLSLLPAGFMKA